MGRFIDKGFCDEDDPIFTEGITAFSLRRNPQTLDEVMGAANCHEAEATNRKEPDSAEDVFPTSTRKRRPNGQ